MRVDAEAVLAFACSSDVRARLADGNYILCAMLMTAAL